jgi:hypothetical protein
MHRNESSLLVEQVPYLADVAKMEVTSVAQTAHLVAHTEGLVEQYSNVSDDWQWRYDALANFKVRDLETALELGGTDYEAFRLSVIELELILCHPQLDLGDTSFDTFEGLLCTFLAGGSERQVKLRVIRV